LNEKAREAMAHRLNRVALITPSGWGNLGDAAIIDGIIQNLRTRLPSIDITVFSLNPADAEWRHGVPADTLSGLSIIPGYWVSPKPTDSTPSPASETGQSSETSPGAPPLLKRAGKMLGPLREPVRRVYRDISHFRRMNNLAADLDAIIVAGGGQLDDYWGGSWGHPYTLYKWVVSARRNRCRFIVLGVGTCALERPLSRFFLRGALKRAGYRSFRDPQSRKKALIIGAQQSDPICPDLAFSLEFERDELSAAEVAGRRRIAVSPMSYCDPRIWPTKDETRYTGYIQRLASLTVRLLDAEHEVSLFTTDTADRRAVEDLLSAIAMASSEDYANRVDAPETVTVAQLMAVLQQADLIVASRLHGALLPLLLPRPVIALSYDPKVDALFEDLGLPEYCMPIDAFTVESAEVLIKQLFEQSDTITREVEKTVSDYRKALSEQYDYLAQR
jgi:polysaccharide pyruvyl transferase WcaK-like protein